MISALWAFVCIIVGSVVIAGYATEQVFRAYNFIKKKWEVRSQENGRVISGSGAFRSTNVESVLLVFHDGTDLFVEAQDGVTLCVATKGNACIITLSNGRFLAFSDKPLCETSIRKAADKHVLGPLVSE